MFKWCLTHFVCIYLLLCSSNIFGADLLDIYKDALANDPTFKEAYSTFKANAEAVPQALSALLPQINAGATKSRNALYVDVKGFNALNGQESYTTNYWTVSASQAIFNYQSWSKLQQAKASVRAAHATFNNAAQDLLIRTAKSYLSVLLSRDTLKFAEAKQRANKRQLEQAQQRFNVGVDTITSVYEAKAAYDQSFSQIIAAKNNQINQSENLSRITNHHYDFIAPLRDGKIPLIIPEPNNAEEWAATGIRQNYNLFAAKYKLQASRENIKAQAAAGLPTLVVQANANSTNNYGGDTSNFFVPDKQKLSTIGLTMNYPIFQGGLVEANTKQAQYLFQSASEQLERTYRDVIVNSHIAFNTITDGISKVKADRQTVISQKNSLESTEAQYQVGTRTMVDVVNAQQRLFEAQEQLASDQYSLIISILNLKYLAGTLNVNDLEEINSWLQTTRLSGLPHNRNTPRETK